MNQKPKKARAARRSPGPAKPKGARQRLRKSKSAKKLSNQRSHAPSPLAKFGGNPILSPNPEHVWETKATFNPAAIAINGRVHLLYRAIGEGDMSVLGYASSRDGLFFDERLATPAYVPTGIFEGARGKGPLPPVAYLSGGGGSGGSEDPRIVQIGERIYLTHVAFNGWDSVRMALASISVDDFVNHRWKWTNAALISPPGEIHKNWVLFPEKIHGKYALLHSISPRVLIDYFDDLDELGDDLYIKSHHHREERKGSWDNWIRGAGPPPIKTPYGWLVLYHAMDRRTPYLYKLGAMLLDAHDPARILYRSKKPLLEPEELYELEGLKGGVVYSCGATVFDGNLLVYYGSADSVTCVAQADLETFLQELLSDREPRLAPAKRNHARV